MIAQTSQADKEEKHLISLLSEIIQGFSTIMWKNKTLYIKHHNLNEHARILMATEEKKKEVVARGIPTEAEAIEDAIKRKEWSKKDEEFIQKSVEKIEALTKAAEQMKITRQKEAQYKVVEELKKEIKEKEEIRNIIVSNTAEIVASTMAYNDFLSELLYLDKDFTKKVDENIDLDINDFTQLRILQKQAYTKFDDYAISRATLSDFFKPILQYTDDPNKVFGKPMSEISLFQMKLLSYGYMFNSIFKNVTDIPDFIKKDPEALVEFVNQRDNDSKVHKRTAESKKSTSGATTYFGASDDDIRKLKDKDERYVDFNEELKRRGGSMNMQEMIELCGVD